MFFRLGIKQLLSNKKILALSIITVAIGVGILYTVNIGSDTIRGALEARTNFMFGNVDYTVYQSGQLFYDNESRGIPYSEMANIKAMNGVDHVVARASRAVVYYSTNDIDILANDLASIDLDNPDETFLGTGSVLSYDPALGSGNKTIEQVLDSMFIRPLLISESLMIEKGFDVGDKLRMCPSNATKLYATAEELASVNVYHNMTGAELEAKIIEDPERIEQFTIVGIYSDGSECPPKPIAKDERSLSGLVPSELCYYARLNDTMHWILNKEDGMVGYFLVDTSSDVLEGFNNVISTPKGNITIISNNIRVAVQGYVDYVYMMVWIALLLLTISAWVSSVTLIIAISRMNIQEKIKEIGTLLSIGYERKAIAEIVVGQFLVVSLLGMGVGMLFGILPTYFFDTETIGQFLSYNKVYDMQLNAGVIISLTSTVITMIAGMLLPLIASLYPFFEIRKWSIVEMLTPLGRDNKIQEMDVESHKIFKKLKTKKGNVKAAVAWVGLIALSFITLYIAASNMFVEKGSMKVDIDRSWYWILLIGVSGFFFIIGLYKVSTEQVAGIAVIFARAFQRVIGPLANYSPQAIQAKIKQIKDLAGFLTMGISLVMGSVILHDTIVRGDKLANRTYLGADIMSYSLMDRSVLPDINALPGIQCSTIYSHIPMDSWEFNSNPSTRYVVNEIGTFGGMNNGVIENLNVVVIDPEEYIAMNPPVSTLHDETTRDTGVIYDIDKPNSIEDSASFIRRLNTPMTTILETRLLDTLGKDIYDNVEISINGFVGTVKIVGSASNLPSAPYMRLNELPTLKHGTMLISRDTLSRILGDFCGGADIFIKNMTLPASFGNKSITKSFAGYSSGLINFNAINSTIYGVEGVDEAAYRFSTFAPGYPSLNATYHSSQEIYRHVNLTIAEGDEFPLPSRTVIVDGWEDLSIKGSQENIIDAHEWLSRNFMADARSGLPFGSRNHSASEALYTIDQYLPGNPVNDRSTVFANTSLCLVNKYVVAYEDINNQSYVYEMRPGDNIKFTLDLNNGTARGFNFTVAATLDNHLSFYHENGTQRDGFKLSSKTLNYNFNANESAGLQDLFDMDANLFITTRREINFMVIALFGALGQFANIDGLDGLKANEIANHVQIKIKPGHDVSTVANELRSVLGPMNFSVFEYKRAFIDKLANTGALGIVIEPTTTVDIVLHELELWFVANGYEWQLSKIGTAERLALGSDILIITPMFNIIYIIAIVSLLGCAFALSTMLYALTRNRTKEFGIYKAIGYSDKEIRNVIFFQSFIVMAISIALGIFGGIGLMWAFADAVKSSVLIPMIFSIPLYSSIMIVTSVILVAVITSEMLARFAKKRSSVESIRARDG